LCGVDGAHPKVTFVSRGCLRIHPFEAERNERIAVVRRHAWQPNGGAFNLFGAMTQDIH
jgi:hypothetical protein